MVVQLRFDTSLLRETGAQQRGIATEFEHANTNSDDTNSAVGHSSLTEATRSFAYNWHDQRAKMLANITILSDAATRVGEACKNLDAEFVTALRGQQ